MRLLKILTLKMTAAVAVFSTLGCGNLIGSVTAMPEKGIVDFLKTEILIGTPGIADGTSEMVIAIHLKNSDNTSVAEFRPTYTIASGTGVTPGKCSVSDSNGISACVLKATQPGKKLIKLTNAKVGLEKEVVFENSVKSGRILGLVSGSKQNLTTPDGYKGEVSFGDSAKGISFKTSGGYKVMISTQGAFLSR